MQLGLVGLGRMGANMTRRLIKGGHDLTVLFDVYCNGVALLRGFDINKEAGGSLRALTRRFTGLKPNAQGKLLLSFVPTSDYACVNAIEIEPEKRRAVRN